MPRRQHALLEELESRISLSASPWPAVTPAIAQVMAQRQKHAVATPHHISAPLVSATPAPTGLTATVDSASQVTIRWNHAAGESGYNLERSTDGATWARVYSNIIPGDTNFDGIVDGADLDAWFTHIAVRTDQWSLGEVTGDGFIDGGDFDMIMTHLGEQFSTATDVYRDTSVQAGTTYQYRLAAASAAGVSGYSASVSATPENLPPPSYSVNISTRYGNELVIAGTSANDVILVSQAGSLLTIVADGQSYLQAAPAAGLFIYGYGGNDTITVDASVTLRTTIESIAGTADTIVSLGSNVSAWIDNIDNYTGTASVHRVTNYYQSVTKAVGATLAQPTDAGTLTRVPGSLWGTGPRIEDINQGSVGDCYFLSSLGSLAFSTPSYARELAVDMGDGTYTVQFVRSGVANYVRVDDQFPAGYFNGGLKYAHPGASGAMWGAVIEKAYAFFRTGACTYASLASGWMSSALSDVGVATNSVSMAWSETYLFNTVTNKLAAGKAVTLATTNGAGAVVSSHAYSVVGTYTDAAGQKFFTLRNPWGMSGGSLENSAGYVNLTYAQLQLYFPTGGSMAV